MLFGSDSCVFDIAGSLGESGGFFLFLIKSMGRNVEIKARADNLDALAERAKIISQSGPIIIDQKDIFFQSQNGRLKLRCLSDSNGELIFYDRPDTEDPTESNYVLLPINDLDKVINILSRSLGIRGVVRKRRILYLSGQTRIHLDDVEELGTFVELEVVMRDDQTREDGIRVAREVMSRLEILDNDLVAEAYIDLLTKDHD